VTWWIARSLHDAVLGLPGWSAPVVDNGDETEPPLSFARKPRATMTDRNGVPFGVQTSSGV
jgi:hypothetical protein